jgi:Arc/MetJ-type ribon-helix-helix transcriptional regulator
VNISISLPDELVRYIDERVTNRSQLIESLILAWQRKQQQQAMLAACLFLDEQISVEDDEKWEQAAIRRCHCDGTVENKQWLRVMDLSRLRS